MFKPKQFKLDSRGPGRILGDLEARVMERVWESDGSTVREMCANFTGAGSLSFNTLMTIMNRLVDKGLLKKKSVDGQYRYVPAISKGSFCESVSSSIAKSLIKDPAIFSLASFVETLGEDPDKLKELKKLIDKKWKAES